MFVAHLRNLKNNATSMLLFDLQHLTETIFLLSMCCDMHYWVLWKGYIVIVTGKLLYCAMHMYYIYVSC